MKISSSDNYKYSGKSCSKLSGITIRTAFSVQNIDAQEIAKYHRSDATNFAKIEDDIQIEVEHILRDYFRPIRIDFKPHHNVTVVNRRPDTLYGRVI
jgi:hypothetical protein